MSIESAEALKKRKAAFEEWKETQEKEPEGAIVKKQYVIGCKCKEDWEFIHAELTKEGSKEDCVPSEECECYNDCRHSDIRGVYALKDSEAEELKKHPKVEYAHIRATSYPGTYSDNPDDFIYTFTKTDRYDATAKHQKDMTTGGIWPASSPGNDLINRGGSKLYRKMFKEDPWAGGSAQTIFDDKIAQYGTGEGVDALVCDQDAWYGHIEFQNNAPDISGITTGPSNYIGGNVLKSGFAPSATSGTCDLLDLYLDSPYYLDPDFFEANTHLFQVRWDGTTVTNEIAARAWWNYNDTAYRSSKFVSPGNGGTASGYDDFGTIPIHSTYTRQRNNGSSTLYQSNSGYHATPCCSQVFGRTQGWAYNANKWHLNVIGYYAIGLDDHWDLQKIFNRIKPVNPTYGTRDPMISSNSWGLRQPAASSGYYYFREGYTGGTGVSYSSGSKPEFMNNYYGTARVSEYLPGHAAITAGDEAVTAVNADGNSVIFVYAAGNHNQKMVQSDHPDYNNFHHSSSNADFVDATEPSVYSLVNYTDTYRSENRAGFPIQIGMDDSGPERVYRTLAIGALHYSQKNDGGVLKERRVYYSNVGNIVDCFATAANSLAASDDNNGSVGVMIPRADDTYPGSTIDSTDRKFGGTSSATPHATGLLATKLQYARDWSVEDVKTWLVSLGEIDLAHMYQPGEPTTAMSGLWDQYQYSLMGAPATVIYDALTGEEPGSGGGAESAIEGLVEIPSDIVKDYNAREIASVTPKFYIEDDGTDYTDGEEFNGLWSGGIPSAPTGYADVGHWQLNERLGNIAYNNRIRSQNQITFQGMSWGQDAVGDYLQYKLVNNLPLANPNPQYFMMMSAGGNYVKTTQWKDFLQSPGFDSTFPETSGQFQGEMILDMWVHCRKPPQTSGERQTLFYLKYQAAQSTATGTWQKGTAGALAIENEGGTLKLSFYISKHGNPNGGVLGLSYIKSTKAATLLYPKGLSEEGGLHHIALVMDVTQRQITGDPQSGEMVFSTHDNGINSYLANQPYGFYVDGEIVPADGTTTQWSNTSAVNGVLNIDTNAMIGCEMVQLTDGWDQNQSAGDPSFRNHFLGKIYQVHCSFDTTGVSRDRIRSLFNLKFDIPRGPQSIDFSDKNEFEGVNLLTNVGTLKQVIENEKGVFYVTFNSVKVKN